MAITVVAAAYGGPEVVTVVDAPTAEPAPGQVLVDVRAAGTNPVDYKLYSGAYGHDPAALPMALGYEAAGVVRAVGGEVEGPGGPVLPGDEVIVYRQQGAYASELLAHGDAVLPKPSGLTFEEASGLMLAGTTAVHALRATGVQSGDTLIVHGASGGVGLMVVQLAVAAGVTVIATAGESQHEMLRGLGAEPVSYGTGLADRARNLAPRGLDAAIDTVGTDEAVDTSVELVVDHNRIATIAAFGRGAELGIKVLGSAPGADPGTAVRSAARLELVRQAGAGHLQVFVATTFPLTEAAAAHRLLAAGHSHGKIVLLA